MSTREWLDSLGCQSTELVEAFEIDTSGYITISGARVPNHIQPGNRIGYLKDRERVVYRTCSRCKEVNIPVSLVLVREPEGAFTCCGLPESECWQYHFRSAHPAPSLCEYCSK